MQGLPPNNIFCTWEQKRKFEEKNYVSFYFKKYMLCPGVEMVLFRLEVLLV